MDKEAKMLDQKQCSPCYIVPGTWWLHGSDDATLELCIIVIDEYAVNTPSLVVYPRKVSVNYID